jgi:predicted transcriptional regulator
MRRSPGELEGAIIDVLDSSPGPKSVAEVGALLPNELAHTTVMTALVRLTEKGLLTRKRRGRGFEYSLAQPVDSLPAVRAASRMRAALDSRVQRAEVLANFVASLDPAEEAMLRKLLDDADAAE